MSAHRLDQVNELLLNIINEYITREIEITDFFITLSKIDVSKDLRYAKVYITVIPDDKRGSALKILRKHKNAIQKYISGHTKIKFTPVLTFVIDPQIVYGSEMEKLLDEINNNKNDT
jgi:ribosome-binding factor A